MKSVYLKPLLHLKNNNMPHQVTWRMLQDKRRKAERKQLIKSVCLIIIIATAFLWAAHADFIALSQ